MSTDSPTHETLEERIFQRLHAWQQAHPDGQGPRDPLLESDIYSFLYRELRGVAAVLPGMGWMANHPKADVSCRFTSVLNKAFLRILEKSPNELMRARSRQQLTGYVSKTMSNLMLNHYRRKGIFRRIAAQLGMTSEEDAQVRDILTHLTKEKAEYFESRTGVSFQQGLELIRQWDDSPDPVVKARGQVLRLRYVDSLSYDDIAADMAMSKTDVENLLVQAKYHLRKLKR